MPCLMFADIIPQSNTIRTHIGYTCITLPEIMQGDKSSHSTNSPLSVVYFECWISRVINHVCICIWWISLLDQATFWNWLFQRLFFIKMSQQFVRKRLTNSHHLSSNGMAPKKWHHISRTDDGQSSMLWTSPVLQTHTEYNAIEVLVHSLQRQPPWASLPHLT